MISVQHNLDALNSILPEYARVRGWTTTQVLVSKGSQLAFALSQEMRKLSPGRGSIRAERLAALKSGEGVHVRPGISKRILASMGAAVPLINKAKYLAGQKRIERKIGTLAGVRFKFGKQARNKEGQAQVSKKGRKLNLQALMVQAELNARERGIGYLGIAARMNLAGLANVKLLKFFGKYKQQLSSAGLGVNELGQELRFTYGGEMAGGKPVDVGTAYQKPQQQAAISRAIGSVQRDTKVYLARKHAEALESSIRRSVQMSRGVVT